MLFFIHIPKAAGTSLRLSIARAMPQCVTPLYHGKPGKTLHDALAKDRTDPEIVFGHFSWGIHKHFGAEPNYATVLRNPISRLQSWYNYQGSRRGLPFYNRIAAGDGLETLAREGAHPALSNHMTRLLCGWKVLPGDRRSLEVAKDRLSRFAFVGIQEHLAEDVDSLASVLGTTLASPNHLMSGGDNLAGAEVTDEVRRVNQLDEELFQFALEMRRTRSGA